ncbi:MAG: site-2 protease family protein [Burkholderiales bacterium]|nr:site-2 protease family protein [Anaerolineae bacterium]
MFFQNLSIESILANLIALGIGMTIHEFAHNYVAHLNGDPVPAQQGRLTLNPLVHINWIGWLMFAVVGFGVLGSAPISPTRMRNPRWGFLAAVAAGPLSNLLVAIVFAIPLRFIDPNDVIRIAFAQQIAGVGDFLIFVLAQTVFFNIILFLFNLIPLFPLDGWHMVLSLLPPELAYTWQRHQQTTYYLFFGLILLSFVAPQFNILGYLISQPAFSLYRLLLGF